MRHLGSQEIYHYSCISKGSLTRLPPPKSSPKCRERLLFRALPARDPPLRVLSFAAASAQQPRSASSKRCNKLAAVSHRYFPSLGDARWWRLKSWVLYIFKKSIGVVKNTVCRNRRAPFAKQKPFFSFLFCFCYARNLYAKITEGFNPLPLSDAVRKQKILF